MKKIFILILNLSILFSCDDSKTKRVSSEDSSEQKLDSQKIEFNNDSIWVQKKVDSSNKIQKKNDSTSIRKLSNIQTIANKFQTKEIAQELIDRGYLQVYKNTVDIIPSNLHDTIPRVDIQFESSRNKNLSRFSLLELHQALSYQLKKALITKSIHDGKDKRYEVYQDEVKDYIYQTSQVMGIFPVNQVSKRSDIFRISSGLKLSLALARYENRPLCDSQRFFDQVTAAIGTAFPIDSVTIITAAHCIDGGLYYNDSTLKRNLDAICFIFGFSLTKDGKVLNEVPESNYYKGVSINHRPFKLDCSIIKLSRPIKDYSFIPQFADSLPKPSDEIFMVGYPNGLPKKITIHGKIIDGFYSETDQLLSTDLDAFRGNSGSPVFDSKSKKVIGMLIEGDQDYVFSDKINKCNTYRYCSADYVNCSGEIIINMINLLNKLNP